MSKLEPTRTCSNLTATEHLRRLLDERGVEWWQSANTLGCIFTRWYSPIFGDEVVAMENGEEGLVVFDHYLTPEQAIAATLGSCNCSNSERTSDSDATAERRGDAVEDVLRDVVTLCHNTWKEESPFHFYDVDDVMKSGNIAEFASRLRLAGDAE